MTASAAEPWPDVREYIEQRLTDGGAEMAPIGLLLPYRMSTAGKTPR